MGSEVLTLIIIWFLAVIAFFALWAILLKVVKRISERKNKTQDSDKDGSSQDKA